MQTEVEHLVSLRVPEAVRSVMKEAAEVKAQFGQLSEHALLLTEENCALRERRSRLSVDVGNLEQMLKEASRQSCVQKKVITPARFSELLLGTCLHIEANSPDVTQGYIHPICAFSASSSSLHQTREQLQGKYQRLEHELEGCREELKQLQTKHRAALAEMEAHRSLYSCFSCLREV